MYKQTLDTTQLSSSAVQAPAQSPELFSDSRSCRHAKAQAPSWEWGQRLLWKCDLPCIVFSKVTLLMVSACWAPGTSYPAVLILLGGHSGIP